MFKYIPLDYIHYLFLGARLYFWHIDPSSSPPIPIFLNRMLFSTNWSSILFDEIYIDQHKRKNKRYESIEIPDWYMNGKVFFPRQLKTDRFHEWIQDHHQPWKHIQTDSFHHPNEILQKRVELFKTRKISKLGIGASLVFFLIGKYISCQK